MSATNVDQRVVEMRFDNQQFEAGVSTTMSTLSKFKDSLDFKDSIDGLDDLNAASKKCDMGVLGNAIETVQAKFSAMQVIGITALANITNSAVNAGKRMVSAFTIDPVKTGLQEYETQINSVQTILANTASKGTNLEQVNAALDQLNKYADMTIYNFTEMTRNIGTFTAAGIDLDTSVNAIQGIANLAAVSGSTSQQASTAMYQLSQALATGTVKLMDWNSVVNAGMGGQVFQDALRKTSEELKTGAEAAIKAKGSFRESLQTGWLTADVLTKTLKKFTSSGANEYVAKFTGLALNDVTAALASAKARYGEADAIEKASEALAAKSGKNKEEIAEILNFAKTAEDAATKVKTFTQLLDTLKEAAQSGWTQSWEYIIGDFEEAKEFYTYLSDSIGGIIGAFSDARNNVLLSGLASGWKQLLQAGISDSEGFKEVIVKVAKSHGISVEQMIKDSGSFEKSLKNGWLSADVLKESINDLTKEVNGYSQKQLEAHGYTSDQVQALNELNDKINDGSLSVEKFAEKMETFSGRENLFESLKNVGKAIGSVAKPIQEAMAEIFNADYGAKLYDLTENVLHFTEGLTLSDEAADKVKRTFTGLFSIVDVFRKVILGVASAISAFLGGGAITSLADLFLTITAAIGDFFTAMHARFDVTNITSFVSGIAESVSEAVHNLLAFKSDVYGILPTIGAFVGEAISGIWDGFKELFDWVNEHVTIGDIINGIFAASTVVGIKAFLEVLREVKDVLNNGILGLIFGTGGGGDADTGLERTKSFQESFADILDSTNEALQSFTDGIKVASVVAIAVAIGILSKSLKELSGIRLADAAKSLGVIATLMFMLGKEFDYLTNVLATKNIQGIVKAGVALVVVSEALKILANIIVKLSDLSLGQLAIGLAGIGGSLAILAGSLKMLEKVDVSLKTAAAILVVAESCKILATSFKKFAELSFTEIGQGLAGMGGALAELSAVLILLNKFGGDKGFGASSLIASVSLTIVVKALDDIANALKSFGDLSWDQIGQGLAGMGGALAEVAIACGVLGKIAGFSSILGSGAILIVSKGLVDIADAFTKFAILSWDQIAQGAVAMGAALGEIALAAGALGKIAGVSSLIGAGAILIVTDGLGQMAEAFEKFAYLDWSQVGVGLVGMGGALAEVATISGALGTLAGAWSLVGAAAIVVAVQGLGDLASAFQVFGSMSWGEVGRGLVGMGLALTELSTITGLLGGLGGIPALIGGGAILLAVQGLGQMADALKKFGEMEWENIHRGLYAMAGAMSETALGGLLNTLSGFGAGAIAAVAKPLGDLADSMNKWKDVTMPDDLAGKLRDLADGVGAFTMSGWGAESLATVSAPMGTLADSISKWKDVSIPSDLGSQLSSLADGVGAFTMSGWGADTIVELASPLGTLADSISKWSTVQVPDTLGDQLTKLSDGVKSFAYANNGTGNISELAEPIGTLAESVAKWKDVSVPEDLGDQLENLSSGLGKFIVAVTTGVAISTLAEPLGILGSAVKKFANLSVPEDIGTKLESLGSAVGKLANGLEPVTKLDNEQISSFATGIAKLRKAIDKINDVDEKKVDSFISAIKKLCKIKVDSSTLTETAENVSSSVSTMMSTLKDTVSGKKSEISKSMSTAMSGMTSAIKSSSSSVESAAGELVDSLTSTVSSKTSSTNKAFVSLVSTAVDAIKKKRSAMVGAGHYLGEGLIDGIGDKEDDVYKAAYALGKKAVEGEKDGQESNSPSKATERAGVWFGQGLIIGMQKMTKSVYNAGKSMGTMATDSMAEALSIVSDISTSEFDASPTITPVVDLTNVRESASTLGDMLNGGISTSLGTVNAVLSQRIQNGGNSDILSAIERLNRSISSLEKPTYNINGITYDDGSNIANAIGMLTRAAVVERRI